MMATPTSAPPPGNAPVRHRWAAPGSTHDRLVRWTKIALPMAVGVILAVLALAPLDRGDDVSFILDKNKVDSVKERMRVENARYAGLDKDGRPFTLVARRAVQPQSDVPIVDIEGMLAELALAQGPLRIAAAAGRYDLDRKVVSIPGQVNVAGPEDYRMQVSGVTADLGGKTLTSSGAVSGRIGLGPFSAGRMSADLEQRTVVFDRGARLKIEQGTVR